MEDNFYDRPKNQAGAEQDEEDIYPRSVKFGVFLLAGLMLVLVGVQLQQRFMIDIPKLGNGADTVSNVQQSLLDETDENLKQQDSDEDGLSDYQELRVYGTSPFIADSDSDGITDPAEIEDGTDPNCPEGQNCFAGEAPQDAQSPTQQFNGTVTGQVGENSEEVESLVSSPEALRELLLQAGADPEIINNLDQQTLQALGADAYETYQNPEQENIDTLSSFSPEQIREFLISNGTPAEEIEEYSDEELAQLFQDALREVGSEPSAQ